MKCCFNKRSQRREEQGEEEADDPSVFPLATPLIADPGAIAAMILLVGQEQETLNSSFITFGAMSSVIVLVFLGFLSGNLWERFLGKTGVNVTTRLMGMLLAALSVQFVVDGLSGLGIL